MSKATQYLGHTWTHRSEFQRTEGYGRINLDDCLVTGAKALAPDSDDELPGSERASKRRRVEKLAEGYLRGEKLFIPSARPGPQALRQIVARQKRSSKEPGFKLPDIDTSPESAQIWKDVEDDGEILRRLLRARKPQPQSCRPGVALSDGGVLDAEPTERISAQATCKPQRRTRDAGVSVDPSEEAFRQAAALRNRRGRTVAAKLTTVAEESTPALSSDGIVVTQSERVLRSQRDRSEWLSRRKSRFSFGDQDASDGVRTAGSPCVAASSPSALAPGSHAAASSASRAETGTLRAQESVDQPQQKASYRTAPEDLLTFEEPVEASSPIGLHQQQHSSSSSNGTARLAECDGVQAMSNETSSNKISNVQSEQEVVEPAVPATRHQPLRGQIGSTYLRAPSSQNGSTPLMYRKRTIRSTTVDKQTIAAEAQADGRRSRRRITFPSSEDVPASEFHVPDVQHVASHPPMLHLSFQHDDSFAPKLNMALVNEHKNTLLPANPSSAGRTSAVKKTLHRELKDSGAEITRCDSGPPPSSQLEDAHPPTPQDSPTSAGVGGTISPRATRMSSSERRQTWLGTQAMVARAERELFISPDKPRNAFTPINEQTPGSGQGPSTEHTRSSQERAPLKQLSQEPAPSTQAMLETWGGFSTVKKPRSASTFKHVDDPTPVATKKAKRQPSRVVSENDRSSLGPQSMSARGTEARGSSLRFSISSFDTPDAKDDARQDDASHSGAVALPKALTTTSVATPAPPSSARSGRRSALKQSSAKTAEERPSSHGIFTQSMSLSAELPTLSFQAAQVPEAPVGLLRDPSNLSQTIEDLTRDVLGTTRDMSGLLSQ